MTSKSRKVVCGPLAEKVDLARARKKKMEIQVAKHFLKHGRNFQACVSLTRKENKDMLDFGTIALAATYLYFGTTTGIHSGRHKEGISESLCEELEKSSKDLLVEILWLNE